MSKVADDFKQELLALVDKYMKASMTVDELGQAFDDVIEPYAEKEEQAYNDRTASRRS